MALMSEGGEARSHEAEVEAVARVMLADYTGIPWDELTEEQHAGWLAGAEHAIAALDAVRRSPQGEDHEENAERPT
jgi:hypothetical protein